jgi:hypothetical protein
LGGGGPPFFLAATLLGYAISPALIEEPTRSDRRGQVQKSAVSGDHQHGSGGNVEKTETLPA